MTDQQLEALADAVLEGGPIDWDAAEADTLPADSLLVGHLRLVASVARVHRDGVSASAAAPVGSWGHLRLLECVGRGSSGEVFRAWDTRLDREVALKLLAAERPSGTDSDSAVIREGRLLAKVRHPNVVTIYGAEQIGDRIGLWMEFVRGRTLEELVRSGAVLSAADAIAVGVPVCQAVSAVHAAGLLHRDIKAHNVMRADDGRIVLMDFGTGRERDDEHSHDMTGTPYYLAPEVLRGGSATVQSDIYSLGVLLYRLVTGSYPVQGRTVRELRSAHDQHERTDLKAIRPDLSPKLTRVILRAIDPQLKNRYANADMLANDLTALQPRSRFVRWARELGIAAAALALIAFGWEIAARQAGFTSRPSAMLSAMTAWLPAMAIKTPAIAVLPFQNLGSEPGSEEIAEGLTIGVMQQLAGVEGLQLKSQPSSFLFREVPRDLRDVGAQLGADLIVEGTARLSAAALTVDVRLVRGGDELLWNEKFDRSITSSTEIVAVETEIARAIVNRLRLALGRGQRRDETSLPLPLYIQYVKAQALMARKGIANSLEAARLFEGIVASYPDFAPGWAGVASALADAIRIARPDTGLPSEADVAKIQAAASRAIALDPRSAEAHAALGAVFAHNRDWTAAQAAFKQSLALDPSRSVTYTNFALSTLMPQGRFEEALQLLGVARTVDPLALDVRTVQGNIQVDTGRYDEAIRNVEEVLARDPTFPFAENQLGRALLLSGRTEEALAILEKNRDNWGMIGYAYAVAGRRTEAEALAANQPHLPGRRVQVYAGLRDKDRTFEALDRLVAVNWWLATYLMQRPEMEFVRDDPRMAEVRRKLGLPPR
jgi:TolB-like protein/Flp pilus assembly protein TadD